MELSSVYLTYPLPLSGVTNPSGVTYPLPLSVSLRTMSKLRHPFPSFTARGAGRRWGSVEPAMIDHERGMCHIENVVCACCA